MAKFNVKTAKPATGKSFIVTDNQPTGRTGEGALGYARDAKSELFLLAVTNMVAEKTFYEKAGDRDARFEALVRQVATEDPAWTAGLFGWLRSEANMRTASVVGALEAAKAMVDAKIPGGRQMVNAALQRADEPGEAIAYWIGKYGRKLPKPVKRGIADAAERLYSEYSLLKYDTPSHSVRFGDVLDLTHPDAKAPWQSALYKYALGRRHNREDLPTEQLTMILANDLLRAVAKDNKLALLDPDKLKAAGFTWEDALSLAGNRVEKKALWEALIPTMGFMALLRNLRNFDEAGVSDVAAQLVINKLTSPDEVGRSRQFPFRFLAAYRAAEKSLRWSYPLEKALNLSLANVPELPGRTLVLVDRSGSMSMAMGARSELTRADAAAVFGSAVALRNVGRVTLVEFGTGSRELQAPAGTSLLALVKGFHGMGGTNTAGAMRTHYKGHDRAIIITDEQSHDGNPGAVVPAHVPVYTWNLAGYKFGYGPGAANRHTFGGLTDQSFKVIQLLERGANAAWPWEQVS